jgi:aldehyde:ferredoxin oxidoreductase
MVDNDDILYSYAGKILRVNLSNGMVSTEPTSKYAKDWLGGPGIAIKILYDELKPWVTPYDPANRLIFGAGAFIGTTAPGANKMNISTMGPMTGGWASSCSDSYLGGELKCAGYDSVVLEGKAHSPVYLWIHDGRVELKDASRLWGKTTWETLDGIREELGDPTIHVASIGPAGENLVRGACVIQDKGRAHGRGGIGAVMGSKNLKAIAVKGKGGIRVAAPKRFMEAVTKCRAMFEGLKSTESFHKYGTLGILRAKQAVGGVNYKYFQDVVLPAEMEKSIDPKKTIDKYQVSTVSFPGCAFGGCGRHLVVTEGPYAGLSTEANQFEVIPALQGRLAVWEPTFMLKANALCNQLGVGVDEVGGPIGWAMECYQRGIIDEKDTDGLKLNWGDAGVALLLIKKICYREGFGNLLAEGCARAAEILGRNSSYYALHIKKVDLYEPCRGALGWCLGATTSTRGGGHTTGAPLCETADASLDVKKARLIYGIENPNKPLEYEGKHKMVAHGEALQRVNNCFGVCHYNTSYWDPNLPDLPELAELYSAATGWETRPEDLIRLAMRQLNLEKAFNLRFTNFDRKDDMPTPRDLNEPIPSGDHAGWKMDEEKFDKLLDDYYDLHGWDKKTSWPKRETLVDLGLADVADDLEKIGKLGK